ncbi:MAG: 30S ribosomal protein S8, partial [Dehalococcoidia bacterium]
MNTDPIADMLTRIRNALQARHDFTEMPSSKVKIALAEVLQTEGYVRGFELKSDAHRHNIRIELAYLDNREPTIAGLRRISKPGLRVYARKTDIPRVLGGLGIVIVSTSQGIMTGQQARQAQLGGEVLA